MASCAEQLERGVHATGRYLIRGDIAEYAALRAFIENGEFREYESGPELRTRNRKHKVYSFQPAFMSDPLIMKVRWNNPSYSTGRRLNLWWNSIFRDSCLRAFSGALDLKDAGIPAIDPVAYWTTTTSGRQSYFLYRKLEASCCMKELKPPWPEGAEAAHRNRFKNGLQAMAATIANLHQAGLRHGDLACGNIFLIEDEGSVTAALIDTDGVTRVNSRGRVKQFYDLRDYKRVDFDNNTIEELFRIYCAYSGQPVRLADLHFWRSGWSRPLRRSRKWLRRLVRGAK